MSSRIPFTGTALAVLTAISPLHAEEEARLGDIVVTAPAMSDPVTVETDPKAPRQPLPAADGAALLGNIPGFSVVRKGGTDGDPMFRGLGGSRLNILEDGNYLFGGCGMRMDPPTAYLYPESYDKVTVIKGPQTVTHGGGNLAATVLFERRTQPFAGPGARFYGSLLGGSWGRNDALVDATAGAAPGFVRLVGSRSESGDYEDGGGREVHSRYQRWSGTALAGWTPDPNTLLQLAFERGDGLAAYADRTMDGVKFDREGYSAKLEKREITPLLGRLELSWYHNYVDHVMDNYTLRRQSGMRMVNNPDRATDGARAAVDLDLDAATLLTVGADWRSDDHTKRTASAMMGDPQLGPRLPDMRFDTSGLFGELSRSLGADDRLVAGLRLDRTTAKAQSALGGVAAGTESEQETRAAFARWEHRLGAPVQLYLGVGHAERGADYWERNRVFKLAPEKLTQLDLGAAYRGDRWSGHLAAFYGRIEDFILITNTPAKARNVDALLYGLEADAAYTLSRDWVATATLAYTFGDNQTDHRPLAQVAPLSGTLGLEYRQERWSAGALVRAASTQDRVDIGSGTIAGTDLGPTAGYAVLALNASWRPDPATTISVGVDNLLDRTYAEHVSRAGAEVAGFTQTERVNEPGRTVWAKVSTRF